MTIQLAQQTHLVFDGVCMWENYQEARNTILNQVAHYSEGVPDSCLSRLTIVSFLSLTNPAGSAMKLYSHKQVGLMISLPIYWPGIY